MKALLTATVVLCVTTSSHAVSNRVFENVESLEKIGFVFTADEKPVQDTISFRVRVPKEFKIDDDIGTKPFSNIALLHLDKKVEHGPELIGAKGSHIPIESEKKEDGHREAKISVPVSKAEMSYLVISYAYSNNADWPMLIYIPVASIAKQLQARKDAPAEGKSSPAPPTKEEAQQEKP